MNKPAAFSQATHLKASGQAALMLLEALILELIESNVLPLDRAIEIVQTVVETKQHLIADGAEDEVGRAAVGKLLILENSLRALEQGSSAGVHPPSG